MPSHSVGWGGAERVPDRAKHQKLFKDDQYRLTAGGLFAKKPKALGTNPNIQAQQVPGFLQTGAEVPCREKTSFRRCDYPLPVVGYPRSVRTIASTATFIRRLAISAHSLPLGHEH
jgi:hypothetical protein